MANIRTVTICIIIGQTFSTFLEFNVQIKNAIFNLLLNIQYTRMMSSLVICPYINRLFGFVFCILLKKTFGSKRSVFINNNFIIVIDNLKNSTVLLRLNKITLLYTRIVSL